MSTAQFVDGTGDPNHPARRIAAEMASKLYRPTDNTADPARQAERVGEDAYRADHDARQAAEWQAQQAAQTAPPQLTMRPNPAQGSSGMHGVVEAPPTGATPAERIRAITSAKLDGALLAPHQQ